MESRSSWQTDGPAKIETGTVIHNGHEHSAGGAFVSPTHAIGYPKFEQDRDGAVGILTGWDGTQIGTARIIGSRRALFFGRQSWQGSHYFYIRATIDGRTYSGRGFGSGMIWRGKALQS